MNGILPRQVHAMELSDSLDAVHVFRSWKNVSSGILLGGLLLTQAAFWLIDLGIVAMPPASPGAVGDPAVTPGPVAQIAEESSAAGQPPAPASPLAERIFAELSYDRLAQAVAWLNGILLAAAALLVLSTFLVLQVSLLGRLGGLHHIARAFVMALIAALVLIPWQRLDLGVPGVTWTSDELARWLPTRTADLGSTILFYLRFTGYWAGVVLLLLLAQARSARWSKSITRRLETI